MPDSTTPVICFGQQPCGFFPRRFLWAKILTARRLREEIGGRIVFFFHDSDHDPRETQTILHDKQSGAEVRLNFSFANKLQKKYAPLYAKAILPGWQEKTARQLPQFVEKSLADLFARVEAENVADFCLDFYRALGLLDGIEIVRSSDPAVREAACAIEDFFVDVPHEGEIVRARHEPDGRLRLHQGGDSWIELPSQSFSRSQISPTRDSRLCWMQSVVKCTHYVAGAGEMGYLNCAEAPEIEFVQRDTIDRSSDAYIEFQL
jgi:hypothetical protein